MTKIRVDELTRLAFLGAEQDARALADAWAADSSEHREYSDLANQFKAYRMKRWGLTEFEALTKDCKTVSIYELQAQGGPDRAFGSTEITTGNAND
jgi:hypothetical protein